MFNTDPAVRDQFITGLRQLADYLDAHPDVPVPLYGTTIDVHADFFEVGGKIQVDAVAKMLCVDVQDDTADGGHYTATRTFGFVGYHVVAIPEARYQRHLADSTWPTPATRCTSSPLTTWTIWPAPENRTGAKGAPLMFIVVSMTDNGDNRTVGLMSTAAGDPHAGPFIEIAEASMTLADERPGASLSTFSTTPTADTAAGAGPFAKARPLPRPHLERTRTP